MFAITGLYSLGLYSIGLFLGFMLVPFVMRKPLLNEKEGIELDKTYDQLFLAYKFVDDVDEAPDSCLTEEELEDLREKVLHYEIPYISQKIILFYDHKKGGFSYYANSGIIYKYLNVAARRYVLDYGCKQIFKEMTPSIKKEEKGMTLGPFVAKAGKTLLEKDINQYHYLGTFQDFEKKTVDHKKIDFSEYMKMLEAISVRPIPEPEPKPRMLDFLRPFSSTPKSQSIKID
jgi:hypothetical protein